MEVALPVWENRVSPVFDFAGRVLVAEVENGSVMRKRYHEMSPDMPPFSKVSTLVDIGVHVLICGGISTEMENMIRSSGIRIVPAVTGEIPDVLQAYLDDTLSDPRFRMPGGDIGIESETKKQDASTTGYRHIFGPVPSRRLGRSLGIDLTPFKTCSQDCVFCQLGQTTHLTIQRRSYIPADDVIAELKDWLARGNFADVITLSGSGEPTLHACFGTVLNYIAEHANIPTAILTNGTLFHRQDVRDSACRAHIVKVSLSAWDQTSFEWINRPHPALRFEQLIEGQKAFREQFHGKLWAEVFLIDGMNSTPAAVERIAQILSDIGPDRIHLNTAVRPPAEGFVAPVPADRLASLVHYFHPEAEVITDFSGYPASGMRSNQETVLALLKRRTCTADEIASAFSLHINEVLKYLSSLMRKNQIHAIRKSNTVYYGAQKRLGGEQPSTPDDFPRGPDQRDLRFASTAGGGSIEKYPKPSGGAGKPVRPRRIKKERRSQRQ